MGQLWNHQNFAVAPDRLAAIEECIDALFPWIKFVKKPGLLGYRLTDDLNAGALYFRPSEAAAAVHRAIDDAAREVGALRASLGDFDGIDPDWRDHCGVMMPTVAEWEECVARADRLERERPDLEVSVLDVIRPGDAKAPTDYLYQAFLRIGLLGPLRNIIEIQARRA